jgi:hypothetical protein
MPQVIVRRPLHPTIGRPWSTMTPEMRALVGRLLELNHERYATEVVAGLHERKGRKQCRTCRQDGFFQPNRTSDIELVQIDFIDDHDA